MGLSGPLQPKSELCGSPYGLSVGLRGPGLSVFEDTCRPDTYSMSLRGPFISLEGFPVGQKVSSDDLNVPSVDLKTSFRLERSSCRSRSSVG